MKLTGPLDFPWLDFTTAPFGRRWPKLKPVPPPVLCMRAASFSVPNMLSMVSPIGSTKHAASWPLPTPAPVHVGVFGRNRLTVSSSCMYDMASISSPLATHCDTRHIASAGDSPLRVYLSLSICRPRAS